MRGFVSVERGKSSSTSGIITEQPESKVKQLVNRPPSTTTTSNKSQAPTAPNSQSIETSNTKNVLGCPLGLENLIGTEEILVKQEMNVQKLRVEHLNRYNILNSFGNRMYMAEEENVEGGGMGRPFTITLFDPTRRPVLTLNRPYNYKYGECLSACCNCFGRSGGRVDISLGDGSPLGCVVQESNGTTPLLHIYSSEGVVVSKVLGPKGADGCGCSHSVEFNVLSASDSPLGLISKHWGQGVKETGEKADTIGVNFPQEMEVTNKALLLGAVFLIDFMFFEQSSEEHLIRRGTI